MKSSKNSLMAGQNAKFIYLLVLIPFAIIVLLYELIPLLMLIVDSFQSDADSSILFTFANYKKIFSTLSYQKAITNSLKITLISTAVGILLGEWRGTSRRTRAVLALGIAVLLASFLLISLGSRA